jgi:hypothetical protein
VPGPSKQFLSMSYKSHEVTGKLEKIVSLYNFPG